MKDDEKAGAGKCDSLGAALVAYALGAVTVGAALAVGALKKKLKQRRRVVRISSKRSAFLRPLQPLPWPNFAHRALIDRFKAVHNGVMDTCHQRRHPLPPHRSACCPRVTSPPASPANRSYPSWASP